MKKITLLLFTFFALTFSWKGMAQSVSTQNFATSGSDSTPTVLTINSNDITVNQGQPIQQVALGTFNGLYFGSDECGNYFDFDLSVTAGTADGTVIANGCDADFNGLDVTGFTTITITSNDIDNWTDTVDFDIDLEVTYQTPSCITPLSMSSTSVTSSTVDLTWSAGASGESAWNLEWKAGADFTPGNAEEDATDSASGTAAYNATGLSPNTTYYFYYQADCGGGDTSDWAGPFVVTTLCAAIVPDYTADMSNNPVDACWTEANNGDVTSGPTDLGSGLWYSSNHNGTPSNAINLWSNVKSDWIISPTFDLSTSAPSELNVYVALTEGSTSGSDADLGSDDSVDLLMTTDGGTTWTSLQTWTQGNVPTDIGEQITYDLSAITGNVQFAFLGDEGDVDDTEDVYFHVSQFRVRETPSCVEPSNLDILNVTSTSVDLLWSAGGSESIWNVEIIDVTAGGTVTGTATDVGVSNPFSVSGLTPNNDYEFYVQADCGVGDTSAWVGPYSFATYGDCSSSGTYDYGSNFDATNSVGFIANTPGDYITLTFTAGSTESCCDDWFIVDSADATGNVIATGSGSIVGSYESPTGEISFYVDSDGSVNGTTFEFEVSCSAPPACPDPSALTVTNLSTTVANLGWAENGTASVWNVEVVDLTAGGTVTGTATDIGVSNPFSVSGLTPNNDYEFYVQADCGDGTSAWVGPFAFYTGYCTPSGTSSSTYIDTFSTVYGDTNISNVNSGFSTGNYADNYDTQSISIVPDGTFDFNIEIVSGTVGCAIWIDWNNDLTFDASEVMFSTSSYGSGPFTDSIVIPAATPDGDYRMRVMIDWNDSNPGDDSACGFGSGRGEVEDYKLTIDSSLSTENFNQEVAFKYYPNPVNNNLTLSAQKEINNVSVYNMVGQEVYRSTPNAMTNVVDMSGLQAGAYFVKVTVGNAIKTVKVIKN